MNPTKEHNFHLKQKEYKPGMNLWRCDDCDSEIAWPSRYNQLDVNQLAATKMACLTPEMLIN